MTSFLTSGKHDIRKWVAENVLEEFTKFEALQGEVLKEYLCEDSFPTIWATDEDPPLLDDEDGRYPVGKDGGDFDHRYAMDVLGTYNPRLVEIKLYSRPLQRCEVDLGLDLDELALVVAIHELAHWLAHKPMVGYTLDWRLERYQSAPRTIHETWAQLVTYAATRQTRLQKAFDILEQKQPYPYRVFHCCKHWVEDEHSCYLDFLISHLPELRKLHWPKMPWGKQERTERLAGIAKTGGIEPADWIDEQDLARWEVWMMQPRPEWNHGWKALHHAVAMDQEDLLRAAAFGGDDVNVRTKQGITPLHMASACPTLCREIVKVLLQAGADPNATDGRGRTPLHVACCALSPGAPK